MRHATLGPFFLFLGKLSFACSGDHLPCNALYTLDCHLNNDGRVWKPDGDVPA